MATNELVVANFLKTGNVADFLKKNPWDDVLLDKNFLYQIKGSQNSFYTAETPISALKVLLDLRMIDEKTVVILHTTNLPTTEYGNIEHAIQLKQAECIIFQDKVKLENIHKKKIFYISESMINDIFNIQQLCIKKDAQTRFIGIKVGTLDERAMINKILEPQYESARKYFMNAISRKAEHFNELWSRFSSILLLKRIDELSERTITDDNEKVATNAAIYDLKKMVDPNYEDVDEDYEDDNEDRDLELALQLSKADQETSVRKNPKPKTKKTQPKTKTSPNQTTLRRSKRNAKSEISAKIPAVTKTKTATKTVTATNSGTVVPTTEYNGLTNNGAWCWANSAFQILASISFLKNIQQIPEKEKLPDGFKSWHTLLTFLKKLRSKREPKDKTLSVNDTFQEIMDDMRFNTANRTLETKYNEKVFKYSDFTLVLEQLNAQNGRVGQNDPTEFLMGVKTLFEGFLDEAFNYNFSTKYRCIYTNTETPEKKETHMQIEVKISEYSDMDFSELGILKKNLYEMIHMPKDANENPCEGYSIDNVIPSYRNANRGLSVNNMTTEIDLNYNHLQTNTYTVPPTNHIIHVVVMRALKGGQKSTKPFPFPQNFEVDVYNGTQNLGKKNYTLKAVSCHPGNGSSNGGHHYAFARRDDENWYWLNDSYATLVTGGFVEVETRARNSCYQFIYERIEEEI